MELSFDYWFLQTAAMLITVGLLPGVRVTSFLGALGMVVGLAFVNSFLWDAALFFSVPDSLSLHTVMLLFANGLIFWLLIKLLPGIEIEGFLSALIAPILFTVASALIYAYAKDVDWGAVFSKLAEGINAVRDYMLKEMPKDVSPTTTTLPGK